ncbi:MAG: lipid A deacylase LpxR family protein [Balneolaceae bacterium]|nr:lipid A deacylase LpxR family protein [Balneolaceae bacterium]
MLLNLAHGQDSQTFRNQLVITAENDNFSPPFYDRYYTNGFVISYSRALDKTLLWLDDRPGRDEKSILQVDFNQQIYTPITITSEDISDFDRPYAGYLFLKTTYRSFWQQKHNLNLGVNLGVIGPKAGGRKVQEWWHDVFSLPEPKGWQYQIRNEPVINFEMQYRRSLVTSDAFNIIPMIKSNLGTAFNNFSAGATMMVGQANRFDHSSMTGSLINSGSQQFSVTNMNETPESYLFFGFTQTLVLHNTLIEGSLFGNTESVHTEEANPSLSRVTVGYAHNRAAISWKFTFHHLSTEVDGGNDHAYASISLGFRF